MKKVRIKAHELRDADVSHISLVKRGANQIPFRIIKAEKENDSMINLNLANVFKGTKKEDPQAPEVVGYVLLKDDNDAGTQEVLKESGVITEFMEDCEAECVVYKQSKDADLEGVVPIKLSPELVILTKGIDTEPFKDMLETQGFMPGVSMAFDALYANMQTSLTKSEKDADVDVALSGMVDEFKSYIVQLSKSIPSVAFKASEAVSEYKMVNKNTYVDEEKEEDEDKDKKKDMAAEEEEKKLKKADDGDKDQFDAILKSITDLSKGIDAKISGVEKSVSVLSGDLGKVSKAQELIKGNLEAQVKKSEQLEAKLKGTVIGASPEGDDDPKNTVVKSELGNIDTAYNKSVRTRKSYTQNRTN